MQELFAVFFVGAWFESRICPLRLLLISLKTGLLEEEKRISASLLQTLV